jgi:predicted nucleic acid-binding protein
MLNANLDYEKYKSGYGYLLTDFNLVELYYSLIKTGADEEKAQEIVGQLKEFSIQIDSSIIFQAGHMRLRMKDRSLSYADCVGYITARKFGIPFLTGDKEFKDMEGVIFIK